MKKFLMMALTATSFAKAVSAQITPSSVAAQLQRAGVQNVVVYDGHKVMRATGTNGGEVIEVAYDRRTGKEINLNARGEFRDDIQLFIEGLRDQYNEAEDGLFRDYVAAIAADTGVDLPDRTARSQSRSSAEKRAVKGTNRF